MITTPVPLIVQKDREAAPHRRRWPSATPYIAAFRVAGWNNLKKARRHFSHTISRCLDLITRPVKTVKHQT